MNDLTCDIARDLLPLYHDGVCSKASWAAVEAHLQACPACRAELARMDSALDAPTPAEAEPLEAAEKAWKSARKKAFRKGLGIAGGIFLGIAFLIGLFFCFFSVERMIGHSMEPTLSSGDLCLFRRNAQPERGDIIAAGLDWMNLYGFHDIVRVVGIPGDTVEIRDGTLYVNGEASPLFPAGELDPGDMPYPLPLGYGEYFVLGDNPANSLDSRDHRYGQLSASHILGVYVGMLPRLPNPFVRTVTAEAAPS